MKKAQYTIIFLFAMSLACVILISGGCDTNTISPLSYSQVIVDTAYQGYVYIPSIEVDKGYVSTQKAPPVSGSFTPLSGGRIVVGYDEDTIHHDGYFKVDLSKIYDEFQQVKIYDSDGDLLVSYYIQVHTRQTLSHKVEIVGSKKDYRPEIFTIDLRGTIVKNSKPWAFAGPDVLVYNTKSFTLYGKGYDWDSSDSTDYEAGDNDIIKYEWEYHGDNDYDYSSNFNGEVTFDTGELEIGNYTLTLKVTDDQGNMAFDTMNLYVINTGTENIQPVAHAGYDEQTKNLEVVELDGSKSYDLDGDAITYQWEQTAGPAVYLNDYTAQKPSFTVPEPGTYVFGLRVDDGKSTSISRSEYDFVTVYAVTRETTLTPVVVYHSNSDASGYYYLYTMDVLGNNITKLPTFDLAHSMNPVFSSDGMSVYFQSNYGDKGEQIFMTDIKSGSITAITSEYDNYTPCVSPTADYLAYVSTSTGDRQIFIVDGSGNAPDPATDMIPHQMLTSAGVDQWDPCFSADGNWVVYATDSDEVATGYGNIYRVPVRLDTGETTHGADDAEQLTSSSDDEHSPHFSVNNEIAYIRKRAGYSEVWKMDADGSNQAAVVTGVECRTPRFSSDGQTIFFAAIMGGDSDYEIYSIPASGGSYSSLTSNSAEDGHPDYNPTE